MGLDWIRPITWLNWLYKGGENVLKYIRYHAKKFLLGAGAAVVAVIVMGYAGVKGPIHDFLAIGAIAAGLLGGYGYFSRKK